MFLSIFQSNLEFPFPDFHSIYIFQQYSIAFKHGFNSLIGESIHTKKPEFEHFRPHEKMQETERAFLHFGNSIDIAACPYKGDAIHSPV